MRSRFLALILAATAAAPAVLTFASTAEAKDETYSTRGKVMSFGKDRKYVNIAHEDIPGYMMAMTMSFDPRTASQLDGLAAGDTVKLTFTATSDGKRLIDRIAKE